MDLAPARWLWFPSKRTLTNTFVLFRRSLFIENEIIRARGWITADSRYRLTINGLRQQWGPPPCDPRTLEVDPVDVTAALQSGENVIGVEVLYYGHSEGTWVSGKPGLLFSLQLDFQDGTQQTIVSDESWYCWLDRAHPVGQFKRYYLRSLQEEFDARFHPYGWDQPGFAVDQRWLRPQLLDAPANKPAATGTYLEYLTDAQAEVGQSTLQERQIPLMRNFEVLPARLADAGTIYWQRDPSDWFEMRVPDSFTTVRDKSVVTTVQENVWRVAAPEDSETGHVVTFEWAEQMVGWPFFTIEAEAGTIVEIITQESHDPHGPLWLDSHFFSWSRLICREGETAFELFDYESLRWLQLHIRHTTQPVTISGVGIRRRLYNWPQSAYLRCSEPGLQRLFDASINTLYNSAQETVVDGMGRERQQYSGDCGHQLHAVRALFGDSQLARRYLHTYCAGQTLDGYFLDCWPAYDRLARLSQRQVQATQWGPLLDHSIGFVFDCWHHYLETGDLEAVRAPYAKFTRLVDYLERLRDEQGLLPVENLGLPTVWIDHDAYQQQRHKQCAFNLYTAAMLTRLTMLANAMGDAEQSKRASRLGDDLLNATVRHFWSEERQIFVNNLPWLAEEGEARYCDRSLATAILFDFCPENKVQAAIQMLVECPANMGLSYPANAGWRYWALAKAGYTNVILNDFRQCWANLDSVVLNNTLQESWHSRLDSSNQWSHCAVVPLYITIMSIAGIQATEPGYSHYTIRPQLADLDHLELNVYTPHGAVIFQAYRENSGHRVIINTPDQGTGTLIIPEGSVLNDIGTTQNTTQMQKDGPEKGVISLLLQCGQEYSFWIPQIQV